MKFLSPTEFEGAKSYQLLPLSFRRLTGIDGSVIITNDAGEHLWLGEQDLEALVGGVLPTTDPHFADLEARHFLKRKGGQVPLESLTLQVRSRKAYLFDGPALHILVVTLRCNHSCRYCQVSRRVEGEAATAYDLSYEHIDHAVGHVLRSPARQITVEFQGGEPLLAFDRIRYAIEQIEERNVGVGKSIRYVITSVLHHLTPERLDFIKQHRIELSTSLDGPAALHDVNRPLPTRDSHARTLEGIALARSTLGPDGVAALTTLTKDSLKSPESIIDAYRAADFHSIALRPLSPYGFAARTKRTEYEIDDFLSFYRRAISYLIKVNLAGYSIDETYASLLLRNILTPFSHGYVDLRSPAGAGFGTWVYNYDGKVYPSDEARMLAAMGDDTFCMGPVEAGYESLLGSEAMRLVAAGSVAESIPMCSDCAYLPFCGSDPIDSYRRQGDVIGHRPTSDFCKRHMGILDLLFEYLRRNDPEEMRVLTSWAMRRGLRETA